MRNAVLLSIFLICNILPGVSQGTLSFDEEDITFKIRDSIFCVEGLYYFSALNQGKYTILFPFPGDTIYGDPYDITVKNMNTGEIIEYRSKDLSSIAFTHFISKESVIMISYCQQLKSGRAKYILKSANYWDDPLIKASYKLITEPGLKIRKFSMIPDKEIDIDGEKVYIWQQENFRPVVDFEIEFE